MGPTQEDVAKRANVSRALVSLVLRDAPNVSEESRRKVLAAADELGYRINAFARSLASKQTKTIGVLINDVTNPYFAAVYSSLSAAAEQMGYDLLVAPGVRRPEREWGLVNTLLEHRVAGVALLSPIMKASQLRRLCAVAPTVVIGRETDIPGADVVTTDERQAARLVIEHLTSQGHTKIAHINGGTDRSSKDRARAYEASMAEAGLRPQTVAGDFTESGGRRGAQALLSSERMPTAIIAANDLSAVGAIGTLRANGLATPGDVSVVGYDDSQIARLDLVRLTTVRQSIDRFGESALELLINRIEGGNSRDVTLRIPVELVVRSTTGRVGSDQPAS